MNYGFNDNMEKVEVFAKSEAYSKSQTFTEVSSTQLSLFGGQIQVWLHKNGTLVPSMPGNDSMVLKIFSGEGYTLFDGIEGDTALNYISVFITPIPGTAPGIDIDVKFLRFTHEDDDITKPYDGYNLLIKNNGADTAVVKADIMFIKQVPQE